MEILFGVDRYFKIWNFTAQLDGYMGRIWNLYIILECLLNELLDFSANSLKILNLLIMIHIIIKEE